MCNFFFLLSFAVIFTACDQTKTANTVAATSFDSNYQPASFADGGRMEKIMQTFPACTTVANTFRFDAGAGIKYFATLHTKDKHFHSSVFHAETIIDKVGSGDCFMGGLIYSLYNDLPPVDTIEFAAAAAYLKLFEQGDATSNKIEKIKERMHHG
jgi:hypothetical protein